MRRSIGHGDDPEHARELHEHRNRGDADADPTRITLAQLARGYLDGYEVRVLGDYATIEPRFASFSRSVRLAWVGTPSASWYATC
jgi:hypothetical protein